MPALLVHDGWLACAAAAQGGIGYVDEPLIAYRQHANQQIGTRFADAGGPPAPTLQLRARRDALGTVRDSLRRLEEVLTGRGASPLALVPLREKLAHVEMRCALPDARRRRIGPVLRDAGRGYYSGMPRAAW